MSRIDGGGSRAREVCDVTGHNESDTVTSHLTYGHMPCLVTCHMSHICHHSHATSCHMSHVTCHMPPLVIVTHHLWAHVTRHRSGHMSQVT